MIAFTAPPLEKHQPLHDLLAGLHLSWSTKAHSHKQRLKAFLELRSFQPRFNDALKSILLGKRSPLHVNHAISVW